MSYISRVYKDSTNEEQYFSKEATESCKAEYANKHICIALREGRTHKIFFVSDDVTIEQILTSFQIPLERLDKAMLMKLNEYTEVFETSKRLLEYTTPFKNLGLNEKNQVLLNLK